LREGVYGTLRAIGTAVQPITFTGTSPTPGWWLGLSIQGQDVWHLNEGSVLKHTIIEYGMTNLSIQLVKANVSHSILRHASTDGLMAAFAGGTVIEFSQIVDNAYYGIENTVGNLILASNNWWGDASGPAHGDCNPGGTGDAVSDEIVFLPFLTNPDEEPDSTAVVQADILSITPHRWFAPADSVTRIWVTLTLRDGNGQLLPGRTVYLVSDLGTAIGGGVTDWKGETLAYVVSDTPGDAELTALVDLEGTCEFVRSPSALVTFVEYDDDPLLPEAEAPYMNGRLEIEPRPIVRGVPSTVSARLTNPTSSIALRRWWRGATCPLDARRRPTR
jgi:hypothetical protein